MNSVGTAKEIHRDVDRLLKSLNPKDQETVLKEAHNIVESLRKIEQISSKVKAQAWKGKTKTNQIRSNSNNRTFKKHQDSSIKI